MATIEQTFIRLNRSKFRSQFHLSSKDIEYIKSKGMDVIRKHCEDFIEKKLSAAIPSNDGKQTPMRGHPVFVAQHATATCCRGCLFKWHHIEKNKKLTEEEIVYIVNIIMKWIENQYNAN
jgi:hypothetical protein